ncbi:hypothetical protein M885DRAFT_505389 [Pelagophyceae sp. CCMP2097]|nr:hypothetical protein M885DRAFT_505389 [Pelagophyceae sp. CCMP2097]
MSAEAKGRDSAAGSAGAAEDTWYELELDRLARVLPMRAADPGSGPDRWTMVAVDYNKKHRNKLRRPSRTPDGDAADGDRAADGDLPDSGDEGPDKPRTRNEIWRALPEMHSFECGRGGEFGVVTYDEQKRIQSFMDELVYVSKSRLGDNFHVEAALECAREERQRDMRMEEEYSYGEVGYVFLACVFVKLNRIHGHFGRQNSGVFALLGAGLGKVGIVATLCCTFQIIMAFEQIEALVRKSDQLFVRYQMVILPQMTSEEKEARAADLLQVEFKHADFFEDDSWLAATCVYVDLTCFSPELVQRISKLCEELVHMAVVITLTKPLVSDKFVLLFMERGPTSWGNSTVFAFERKLDSPELLALTAETRRKKEVAAARAKYDEEEAARQAEDDE